MKKTYNSWRLSIGSYLFIYLQAIFPFIANPTLWSKIIVLVVVVMT